MKLSDNYGIVVRFGNRVTFTTHDGETITYKVLDKFLHCYERVSNDSIFKMLGICDIEETATEVYGYPIKYIDSYWPEYKEGDFDAASRLITILAEHCKAVDVTSTETI